MHIIRSIWIFKLKFNSDGSFERYKARLVGDGKSQQLDVKNAFLDGHLQETVFMHQHMGFRDPHYPDHVCHLKKSLYGLKQAPRAWYQRFADYNGRDIAYILLYVNDFNITSDVLRQKILGFLSTKFAMKDPKPLHYFLGIAVSSTSTGLFLNQSTYAREILEKACMSTCKSVHTPVDTKIKQGAFAGAPYSDLTYFRSLAGALQYLTFTIHDISYAVQQIFLHMHAPHNAHMDALKSIMRYIQGTIDHGLYLNRGNTKTLVSYTDADWVCCPDTRRSTSGYCVYFGDNLISWSSKRQPTLSRSSAEAEYRGVANVVSKSCWLRNLLLELRHPVPKATIVYCDNVSTTYLSSNPVQHQRIKHIELDIHFVWEKVSQGEARVVHVPSRYQIADIFTKGLPRVLFDDFRSSLNI
ncbi:uncharacterized mitochondrial protein AtMg00810-like [Rutidosis leptorrhynchoides]|uniref:uncharacterized mitochondrial protein AtMg00810-like n=1 Tax=Rutidosis leptorrhynchoides TaxID=125765 RepID=UPI003A98F2DB